MRSELPLGSHPGYPELTYHADPGLGSGSIKDLSRSPAAFSFAKRFRKAPTAAMDFGSMFHMKLLQPERFDREVYVTDADLPRRGTKAWAEFEAMARGSLRASPDAPILFCDAEDRARMDAMLQGLGRIQSEMGLNPFEEAGHSECAHFWDDPAGVRGKALVDRMATGLEWLVDVKTTTVDLDARGLFRHAVDYAWATQAAWYMRGVRETTGWASPMFAFAVFQTKAPFSARFMPVPPETLAVANRLVERALSNHAELTAKQGDAPRDPDSGVLELRYPDWFVDSLGE